jgi:Tol biopolymer transport system component
MKLEAMILFVVLASAAAGCGPASGPAPDDIAGESPAPAPYRIVYNVLHEEEVDDYEVFAMELDGTGKRNLTEHPAVDWVCAAHGDRMFMVSDRDGNELRRLTDDEAYLAYDRAGEDSNYDIYLRDMETGETTRLTDAPTYEQGPVFVSVIN